jgi:hypothetical protein
MVCPHCGTGVTIGSACPTCGRAASTPPADQFGTPMPSGLTGYAPPPTTAQLYPEQPPAYPPPPSAYPGRPPAYPAQAPGYPAQPGYPAPPPGWPAGPPQGVPYGAQWGPPVPVGNAYSIAGIVLGVIALVVCPVVFGIAGIVLAQRAHKRGESLGKVALGVSIGGLVGGIALTVLLMLTTSFYDLSFS